MLSDNQPKNINRDIRFTNKVVKDGLRNVASHHVESFNYALDTCLPRMNQYMLTTEVSTQNDSETAPKYPFNIMTMWFEDFELKKPSRSGGSLPYECRLRSVTYQAPLYATIARRFDNEPEEKVTICLGEIPVMVGSKFCNLHGLSEQELTQKKEDCFEFGGYFIINGNERISRMLIMNKRNYPVAFQRPTFINRGKLFSTFAVQMRCVREDMFA